MKFHSYRSKSFWSGYYLSVVLLKPLLRVSCFLGLFIHAFPSSSLPGEIFHWTQLEADAAANPFDRVKEGAIVNDGGISRGVAWGDYDNDGDLDLIVANGTPGRENRDFLYRNEGLGTFARVSKGAIVSDDYVSAGTAWADYDNDGDLDLFVANWGDGEKGENNLFYVNKGSAGGWVTIKTVGVRSNRFGVGTRVHVVATIRGKTISQMQQVTGQTGYGSQSDMRLHFGVGDAARVDSIELFWPSGRVDRYSKLPVKKFFVATEGRGITPAQGKRFPRRTGRRS